MIIIYGEQGTGKSTFAIEMLKNKSNALYLSTDRDNSIIESLIDLKIDFSYLENAYLMDIKYRILESGGLMNNTLEYVVIDSINHTKDNKSYKDKIEYIAQLEKDFGIKIAVVLNILKKMDKMTSFIRSIEGHKTIEVNSIPQVSRLP